LLRKPQASWAYPPGYCIFFIFNSNEPNTPLRCDPPGLLIHVSDIWTSSSFEIALEAYHQDKEVNSVDSTSV